MGGADFALRAGWGLGAMVKANVQGPPVSGLGVWIYPTIRAESSHPKVVLLQLTFLVCGGVAQTREGFRRCAAATALQPQSESARSVYEAVHSGGTLGYGLVGCNGHSAGAAWGS